MFISQVVLAQPRGFCAGLTRAIKTVERTPAKHGASACVFHAIVRNQWVVSELRSRGVVFVQQIEHLPTGTQVVFCAHGVPKRVVTLARRRGLNSIDATCPLVSTVHQQAAELSG